MNELALFAGNGGGILGGKLLGWRTVCAVEIDASSRQTLIDRQNDGCLEPFPIWDDIRTFDGRHWSRCVDIISAGFPCQDISVGSSTKTGINGERSGLWREAKRVVGEVRPPLLLLENSAAITTRGLDIVLSDLAKMGYDARWGVFSAADVGARHERERWFCVASRYGFLRDPWPWIEPQQGQLEDETFHRGADCKAIESSFLEMAKEHFRMDDGIPYPVDQVRGIGNAQVPDVVVLAWETLTGGLCIPCQ